MVKNCKYLNICITTHCFKDCLDYPEEEEDEEKENENEKESIVDKLIYG